MRSVALVDDDEAVLDSLRMLFDSHDVVVHPFQSAEAFLAPPGPPETDALVLDIGLPGMTGLQMLESWKTRPARTRVFVLSGLVDDTVLRRAEALGVEQVLRKPSDESRLFQALGLD